MSEFLRLIAIPQVKTGVVVREEDCLLRAGEAEIRTRCRVVFDVTEFPSATGEIPDLAVGLDTSQPVSLQFLDSGFEVRDGMLGGTPLNKRALGDLFRYSVRYTEPIAVMSQRNSNTVEALFYNLGKFSFNGLPTRGQDPLQLVFDRYSFTISPIPHEYQAALPAISTPWHRPTNLLKLVIDGNGESCSDLETLLFDFRQFMSFAWGHYVGIALAHGTDKHGKLAFAHWGMMRADPNAPSFHQGHWFLPGNAEVLQQILPGYMRRCRDPLWKDAVEWALYWWLSATHPGQRSETAILASLAGLEMIASAFRKHRGISPLAWPGATGSGRGSRGAKSAQKIRAVLGLMKMPTSIPRQLHELHDVAMPLSWDGPEAVSEIRNSLAHPERSGQEGVAFEASQLTMWYLEMALLYLFDFKGECANRTVLQKQFQAREKVPWA